MAKRRSNGEGCISQEASGRYRIVLTWISAGKLVRRAKTAWKKADAVAILDALKRERDRGVIPVGRMTLGQFLDHWLNNIIAGERQESTHDSYKRAITKHIKPALGATPLTGVSSVAVQQWLADMAKAEVGSRTRENAFAVLSAALDHATRLRMIDANPCGPVDKPKHEAEEINPFTLGEAKTIIAETKGTRWHALTVLAFTTGMRIGELLGLEWDRIHWKAKTLRIDQQASDIGGKVTLKKPKTKASIRTVDLTPGAIQALRDHRAILLAEGNAGSPLVFPAPEGGVSGRGNVRTRFWNPLLLRLAIEARGIHHTRHTYATHALNEGKIPILVVSKTLGHSKPSVTLDIYGHVLRDAESRAVNAVAKLFG